MARQGVTGPKNDGLVSKAKQMSISQAGKKNPSRERSILSERDKNVPFYQRKLEKRPEKPLSSDYGDESFDDLPSPSRLLRNRGSGFERSVSPVVDDQAKNSTMDVPAIETKHTGAEPAPSTLRINFSQKDQMKPSAPKRQYEIIEILDDTPPDSRIKTTKDSPVKQSILPLSTKADQSSILKRKTSQDETRMEHKKRVKQTPFVPALQVHASNSLKDEPPLSPGQPAPPISPASPASPVSPVPVTVGRMDLNATWDNDGIDLLDEFKNIIRFI